MVDNILLIISCITLVVWFVQEKYARRAMQNNLNTVIEQGHSLELAQFQLGTMPGWNEWMFRAVFIMWLSWAASVVMIKDGDFAFVLVMLTLFSGIVVLLDKLLFAKTRASYVESKSVVAYLAKYNDDQRQTLGHFIGQDMVVGEYAKSFFPVLAIVLVLRSFIIEPFQIPSASMVPTLQVGDYILVNKFRYGLRLPVLGTKIFDVDEPERGDIMVFFPPHDPRYFIKRVIGLPGDQISYTDKTLTVNGQAVEQGFLAELPAQRRGDYITRLIAEQQNGKSYQIHNTKNIDRGGFSVTVKPGHYFMMGDNRDNSSDSRVWGQVPADHIVGQAFAIWMHWASVGELPSFKRLGSVQ